MRCRRTYVLNKLDKRLTHGDGIVLLVPLDLTQKYTLCIQLLFAENERKRKENA